MISENVLRINNTLITLIMQSGASAELANNMSMTLLYFILEGVALNSKLSRLLIVKF